MKHGSCLHGGKRRYPSGCILFGILEIMGTIRVMSSELSAAIAAGEVVERPASIVKELVENAIDAGATHISVELVSGGIDGITVLDNGFGMAPEDVAASIQRHATSKLRSIEDVYRLSSYGFRGEALPSIGAVSVLTIASRQEGATVGSGILVMHGNVGDVTSVGMPRGTRVSVTHLFEEVPARRKFLKSVSTELKHSLDVVVRASLAVPSVSWQVEHNGREVLRTGSVGSFEERVLQVLSPLSASQLLAVSVAHPHLAITGYVGLPQAAGSGNIRQFLLVNKRPVSDSMLSAAVKQAFGPLIMPRATPVYALSIELPPDMVDVNVHPRKTEVAFVNKTAVFTALKQSVGMVLEQSDVQYRVGEVGEGPASLPAISQRFNRPREQKQGDFYSERPLPSWSPRMVPHTRGEARFDPPGETVVSPLSTDIPRMAPQAAPHRPVLQVHNTYLIHETGEGMRIIDQHAAHERVLFDRLLTRAQAGVARSEQQSLLLPLELPLSPVHTSLLVEFHSSLERIGFVCSVEGSTLRVTHVPVLFASVALGPMISAWLDDLADEHAVDQFPDPFIRALTYLSCRGAVKSGDFLDERERMQLIADFDATLVPFTCPHGRPVAITWTLPELHRHFKRIV